MGAMIFTNSSDGSPAIDSPSLPQVPVTVDTQGRVRTSLEQRSLILAEYERSGVSAVQFAKRAGLKYSTLAGWLVRYRKSKTPGPARPVRLLEAVVNPAQSATSSSLILHLPGGARMEVNTIHQAALAAELVRALGGSC
jgi:transposase-like protein